ncbi:hypothetical protein Fmac_024060 [Flemingia macrophylla]|uniref:Myb/SANT-like domain-containing protein n=1 Tax=Flemingia macrophylla TaxID=520843 RepID=A0ABD1LNA4_9FABA
MNRGKAIAPDSSIGVRKFTKWTDEMDFRLPSAMLDEARLGNRVDGSWTTQVYNNIVEALRQSGLIGITKNNVKNRQKSLKDRWREVHDLFNGLSGFAWDESTRRFSRELNPGDGTQSIPSAASTGTGGTSSSRGTKRKSPMVDVMDAQFDKLTTRLDVFTDYFDRGMASGSRPTRKRTSMDRKGKGTTTSDEAPPRRLPSIEHVLNQTCFFSQRDQMIKYGNEFYQRVVLAPKLMDFQYFATSGLYFHHHLEFQGLQHYVAMSCSYYEDLTKVFYSNLRVSQAGHLYSEVNKTKIKMKSADWLIVVGLKYQGHKLSFTNIPEGIDYDRDTKIGFHD